MKRKQRANSGTDRRYEVRRRLSRYIVRVLYLESEIELVCGISKRSPFVKTPPLLQNGLFACMYAALLVLRCGDVFPNGSSAAAQSG